MIILVLGLALIIGFVIADAILDWVFIAVYALLGITTINSIIHLFKYHKKYNEIDTSDIGLIFLCLGITAIIITLQVKFL